MRLLLLVLNILIGVSLSTNSPELAAASSVKTSKSKGQKLYRAHLKKKSATNPGDVWERIRAGMKIPHPVAALTATRSTAPSALAKIDGLDIIMPSANTGAGSATMKMREAAEGIQSLAAPNEIIRTPTIIAPTAKYTALGLKRLGANANLKSANNCNQRSPAQLRQEYALRNKATIALLNEQIQAQTNFHPELRRRTIILGSKSQPTPIPSLSKPFLRPLSERAEIGHLAKTITQTSPCPTASTEIPQKITTAIAGTQENLANTSPGQAAQTEQNNAKQAMIDERINKHIAAYTQNPGFLNRVAERAHPYLFHIVEGLSKNRLPLELALLPIVESAYQPTAQSPKSAAGLWQFIPSTGKDFNLEQNSEYDERLDIPESTQAAIRFLSGLKDHFKGDWLLALAAYNSGQGTVDNAISRNQAEGLATDFWSLRLPEETKNYVPRLLALSNIFSHPANYGIKLPPVRNEPYFVKVKIDQEFDVNYLAEKDLSTVAKLANLSFEQFSRLNPGYLNPTLSRNGPYTFLMPVDNANQLHQRLASIAQFMAEPEVPVKSVILKEAPQAKTELPESTLSVVEEVITNKETGLSEFATPFLSLNVNNSQSGITRPETPLV